MHLNKWEWKWVIYSEWSAWCFFFRSMIFQFFHSFPNHFHKFSFNSRRIGFSIVLTYRTNTNHYRTIINKIYENNKKILKEIAIERKRRKKNTLLYKTYTKPLKRSLYANLKNKKNENETKEDQRYEKKNIYVLQLKNN